LGEPDRGREKDREKARHQSGEISESEKGLAEKRAWLEEKEGLGEQGLT